MFTCFNVRETHFFLRTACVKIPEFTICPEHPVLAPVSLSFLPEKAQSALIGLRENIVMVVLKPVWMGVGVF